MARHKSTIIVEPLFLLLCMGDGSITEIKETIMTNDFYEKLAKVRQHIHAHPEVSGNEVATTTFIKEYLTKLGIKPLDYPIKTGVLLKLVLENRLSPYELILMPCRFLKKQVLITLLPMVPCMLVATIFTKQVCSVQQNY